MRTQAGGRPAEALDLPRRYLRAGLSGFCQPSDHEVSRNGVQRVHQNQVGAHPLPCSAKKRLTHTTILRLLVLSSRPRHVSLNEHVHPCLSRLHCRNLCGQQMVGHCGLSLPSTSGKHVFLPRQSCLVVSISYRPAGCSARRMFKGKPGIEHF